MYGLFPYIWLIFMVNVGKYTVHGSYGLYRLDPASRKRKSPGWAFDDSALYPHDPVVIRGAVPIDGG